MKRKVGTMSAGGMRGELSAFITRADGTIEDLGVIARTRDPLWFRIKSTFGKVFK
ncbi:hypothetical protein [Sphingomonas paeninsulae]|uniref:hypothetical protein n=1 Tax=Sphingomonas paeninsulae TaxID=2319844 RepID=UPI0013CEB799|nr:hypothetical protein [Sphingomonas paeninsulae]